MSTATTKITYNRDYNEYRVRLFIDGVYQAGGDSFQSCKEDAKDAAAMMIKECAETDKTAPEAIAEQADYDGETRDDEGDDDEEEDAPAGKLLVVKAGGVNNNQNRKEEKMNSVNKISNLEDLKQGYYGTIECKGTFGPRELYCTEIADPDDNGTGWECAEWSLVDENHGEAVLIARCDGYNGIEWLVDDEKLLSFFNGDEEALEAVKEAVTPFDITGEIIAAAKESTLEEVESDYEGECNIWVNRYYLAGTCNAPQDGMLGEDNGDAETFDGADEAQSRIDMMNGETYYLSHGEYARPNYKIVKA